MPTAITDLSDVFWGFVCDVTTLPYESLALTKGYVRIAGGMDMIDHCFALDARVLDLDTRQCELVLSQRPSQEGGAYDAPQGRFLFRDVTALFHGVEGLVLDQRKEMLGRCIDRMSSFVEVSELAACMKASLVLT